MPPPPRARAKLPTLTVDAALADPSRKHSQDKVGNGAVAAGLARSPGADPKSAVLKKDVARKKRAVAKSHPPANKEATSAQDASVPPKDDEVAQGKTANAEKAPKNLEEADEFSDSGKPAEVKAESPARSARAGTIRPSRSPTRPRRPRTRRPPRSKQVVPMAADRPPGGPATTCRPTCCPSGRTTSGCSWSRSSTTRTVGGPARPPTGHFGALAAEFR
jgi:hypothetical protein